MKIVHLLVLSGTLAALATGPLQATPPSLPTYDHVVVVMLENHSYDEVAQGTLPYINDTLRLESANMTQSYGLQHPSQPNYYWTLSGSNQGIVDDAPIQTQLGYKFTTPNLYTALTSNSLTFGGYIDAYPGADHLTPTSGEKTVAGNIGNDTGNNDQLTYVARHVPWLGFDNIPDTVSHDFTEFQAMGQANDYSSLPTVSFVIPALENDMHDYASGQEVGNPSESEIAMQNSDAWLQANIDSYVQWAKTHNSLLILTTDEDSSADWGTPLTPPGVITPPADQITTLFAGAYIVPGNYDESATNGSNNVNVLRTIETIYGLTPSGAQSLEALGAGLSNGPITDIFSTQAVPEPSSYALGLLCMGALGGAIWRCQNPATLSS